MKINCYSLKNEYSETAFTGSITVSDGDKVIGVIGVDLLLANLTSMISSIELGYEGYPIIIDQDGAAIVHPTMAGENLANETYISKMLDSSTDKHFETKIDDKNHIIIYNDIPEIGWSVGSIYNQKNLNETVNSIKKIIFLITVLILAIIFQSLSNILNNHLLM